MAATYSPAVADAVPLSAEGGLTSLFHHFQKKPRSKNYEV